MRLLLLTFFVITSACAQEEEIALVNFTALDQYGDVLLLRTGHGRELIAQKTEVQKKDDEEKRKTGALTSPYLSEVCAINAAIDGEKRVLLSAYVKKALGDRYAIVITDSTCLLAKRSGVRIVDVSLDVVEMVNADPSLAK